MFLSLCKVKFKENNGFMDEWATHIYNSETNSFELGHYLIEETNAIDDFTERGGV